MNKKTFVSFVLIVMITMGMVSTAGTENTDDALVEKEIIDEVWAGLDYLSRKTPEKMETGEVYNSPELYTLECIFDDAIDDATKEQFKSWTVIGYYNNLPYCGFVRIFKPDEDWDTGFLWTPKGIPYSTLLTCSVSDIDALNYVLQENKEVLYQSSPFMERYEVKLDDIEIIADLEHEIKGSTWTAMRKRLIPIQIRVHRNVILYYAVIAFDTVNKSCPCWDISVYPESSIIAYGMNVLDYPPVPTFNEDGMLIHERIPCD